MDDDDDLYSGEGPAAPTATVPARILPTTPPVAEQQNTPAWVIFILFIVLCLLLILFVRCMLQRCCGPAPEGPPLPKTGKILNNMRFGSPEPHLENNEMELSLLEPIGAETDDVDVVVSREAKIK